MFDYWPNIGLSKFFVEVIPVIALVCGDGLLTFLYVAVKFFLPHSIACNPCCGGLLVFDMEWWSLSGGAPIANRIQQLIESTGRETVLIIGRNDVLMDELLEHLQAAQETGLRVLIETVDDQLRDRVEMALSDAQVFVSGLRWLNKPLTKQSDNVTISRLLLIDQNTILVSSV